MNDIKELKSLTPLKSGELVARAISFWASERHSELVQRRIAKNKDITKSEVSEMAGEMRAYIQIMEYATKLENACKLEQDRS